MVRHTLNLDDKIYDRVQEEAKQLNCSMVEVIRRRIETPGNGIEYENSCLKQELRAMRDEQSWEEQRNDKLRWEMLRDFARKMESVFCRIDQLDKIPKMDKLLDDLQNRVEKLEKNS